MVWLFGYYDAEENNSIMAKFSAPRGTQDILPSATPHWQFVEERIRSTCRLFGFGEIRTPTFEETDLFVKQTGETTDIVTKEMYTFTDRGGRSLTLRPEGTPPTARAYIEHNLGASRPVTKLYYIARNFRAERPQAGRYREHNQFGVEMFGSSDPIADVEVISLAWQILNSLGIADVELRLNSIGCPDDRVAYREALRSFAEPIVGDLCPTCQERYEKNPLRMLDCKNPDCQRLLQAAPGPVDFLCQDCRTHFEILQRFLRMLGVSFVLDPRLVRGLDYYTGTVFEFQTPLLGAQNTICGGGRYDNMIEQMDGSPTPALGFGMGLERLLLSLEKQGAEIGQSAALDAFVAPHGDEALDIAVRVLSELRRHGISAETEYTGKSLKAQMKLADKLNAKCVMIIGEDELSRREVTLRDMQTKEQRSVSIDDTVDAVTQLLGGGDTPS